jgi:hypothetical protein
MCIVCEHQVKNPGAILSTEGAVAQLVERLAGSQKVRGFEPRRLHFLPDLEPLAYTLGGFIAGEGCFTRARQLPPYADGSERFRFIFQVTVASRDRALLEVVRRFLGVGSIQERPPRNDKWLPESVFKINSHHAHRLATIPFAERFLLPSAKRRQFERWREEFEAYELLHPSRFGKGPSKCSQPDCEKPVRGQGVCRSHYYQLTGY